MLTPVMFNLSNLFDEHCKAMFVYCYGKSVCLSVRLSVTNVLCAQTPTATGVIDGLFESLFHLVLEKLSLVDGGHP